MASVAMLTLQPSVKFLRYSPFLFFISGKWSRVDLFDVPAVFFKYFLWTTKCVPYTIKRVPHMRAPMFLEEATKMTYRTHCLEDVLGALREQRRVVVQHRREHGGPSQGNEQPEDVEAALAWAKARAGADAEYYQTRSRICELDVSASDGRSREFDLIWWPDRYGTNADCGKLTLRFYISKTLV